MGDLQLVPTCDENKSADQVALHWRCGMASRQEAATAIDDSNGGCTTLMVVRGHGGRSNCGSGGRRRLRPLLIDRHYESGHN